MCWGISVGKSRDFFLRKVMFLCAEVIEWVKVGNLIFSVKNYAVCILRDEASGLGLEFLWLLPFTRYWALYNLGKIILHKEYVALYDREYP